MERDNDMSLVEEIMAKNYSDMMKPIDSYKVLNKS